MDTPELIIVRFLSPELIAMMGFTAGIMTLVLAFILVRNDTHLVFDRTDVMAIGCVLILVGIDYLMIYDGQPMIRSQAFSRLAWSTIFIGGLSLSLKYIYKIYRERPRANPKEPIGKSQHLLH